jgi:DNA-binding MarR family transcriptional regulator
MPTVTIHDYRALAEVRYRIRCFLTFSAARAREVGLEPQQHQLLLAIHGLPPEDAPTIRRIADRLQIEHNSAVELVRRSVARGLLAKRPSDRDRREVHLRLTEQGLRVLEKLSKTHRTELRSTAPALLTALGAIVNDKKGRGRAA